jgi:hypothetical protein
MIKYKREQFGARCSDAADRLLLDLVLNAAAAEGAELRSSPRVHDHPDSGFLRRRAAGLDNLAGERGLAGSQAIYKLGENVTHRG